MRKDEGDAAPRQLSRHETHDLSMIIKDRTKVLKAHAEEQAANCLADFETKMATIYNFDDDEVWKKAAEEAMAVVKKAQETIAERCKKLGIPKAFAPNLVADWRGRGENMISQRRAELRRVAKTQIDAMMKAAVTKIEHTSLDLRTQVVSMGVLSAEGKLFLESLSPITDAMKALDFVEIERKLDKEKQLMTAHQRRLYGPDFTA